MLKYVTEGVSKNADTLCKSAHSLLKAFFITLIAKTCGLI